MATALETIPNFQGDDGEDILDWLEEVDHTSCITELDEKQTVKIILLKLKNKAREFVKYKGMNNYKETSLDDLKKQLMERFGDSSQIHTILKEFLCLNYIDSNDSYAKFLDNANKLMKWKYCSTEFLMDKIITASPIGLKSALALRKMENALDWQAFYTAADRFRRIINEEEWKIKEKKDTKVASRSNMLKKRTRAIFFSSIAHRKPMKDKQLSIEKKPTKLVSAHTASGGNPFFRKVVINEKPHLGLIDTGADCSIIHKKDLPANIPIHNYNGAVKSASGNKLQIEGQIRDLNARIGQTKFSFSPLVTNKSPTHTIVGAETIAKYPQLIFEESPIKDILRSKCKFIKGLSEDFNKEFEGMFKTEIDQMSLCTQAQHQICTTSDRPIYNRSERIPVNYEAQINEEMKKLLRLGIIRPSESAWSSRIVAAPKDDGGIRVCIDYRPLNLITKKDAYPIPRIDEILDAMSKGSIFSSLDATSGYYQIAMDPNDIEKTAFNWKGGLFEFTRMPFGLCNAPATFQRAMDKIFKKEAWDFVVPYLDDVIIFSKTEEDHEKHLRIVLGRLKAAGIALNQKKCKFFQKEIKILGNIVENGKVRPDPKKIEAIQNYERPTTIKELRSFIGLANYVRNYIPDFARISLPLSALFKGETKKSIRKIEWTKDSDKAFKDVKAAILNITYRAQPDFSKDFILTTDASNDAIGAVLTQIGKDGKEEMIGAFSKKLDDTQKNYSVTDKELLAVLKSIENYRHYLLGKEFLLRTDHRSIEYLWSTQNTNSRLLRWALKLQEYKFRLEYIKGEENIADGLSRPNEVQVNRIDGQVEYSDEEKNELLSEYHLESGHGSASCMKFLISKKYSWKGIYKDVEEYVKKCIICLKAGEAIVNTKNKIISSSRPNELWQIDLIGRISGNHNSNKFIFVAIDHYSKWIETAVLETKDGHSVRNAIEALIIKKHGIPERILTDNGKEFLNSEVLDLINSYGIQFSNSSPNHHETMGAVERVNQTLMNKLRKISDFGRLSWERQLAKATEAVNCSYNRSIKTSPFVFKYGKTPTFAVDKKFGIPEIIHPRTETKEERDKHHEEYARKFIEKGKIEDRRLLKRGDNVLIFREPLSDKFRQKWYSGFKIIDKIEPDAYIVSDGKKTYRLNKSHVKKDFSKEGERDVVIE